VDGGLDDMTNYISGRYLLHVRPHSFDVHVRTATVGRLEIHLPGVNRVLYSDCKKKSSVFRGCIQRMQI
jgi:hypothetical protein